MFQAVGAIVFAKIDDNDDHLRKFNIKVMFYHDVILTENSMYEKIWGI